VSNYQNFICYTSVVQGSENPASGCRGRNCYQRHRTGDRS